MPTLASEKTPATHVRRRTVTKGAAWAVPAVVAASAAPAYAASSPAIACPNLSGCSYWTCDTTTRARLAICPDCATSTQTAPTVNDKCIPGGTVVKVSYSCSYENGCSCTQFNYYGPAAGHDATTTPGPTNYHIGEPLVGAVYPYAMGTNSRGSCVTANTTLDKANTLTLTFLDNWCPTIPTGSGVFYRCFTILITANFRCSTTNTTGIDNWYTLDNNMAAGTSGLGSPDLGAQTGTETAACCRYSVNFDTSKATSCTGSTTNAMSTGQFEVCRGRGAIAAFTYECKIV